MDTPYQWTKQVASHWGGTRNGTIVHWPNGIDARGRDPLPVPPRHRRRPDRARGGRAARADDRATACSSARSKASAWLLVRRRARPPSGTRRSTSRCSATAASITRAGPRSPGTARRGRSAPRMPAFDDDVWELYATRRLDPGARPRRRAARDSCAELQQLFLLEAEQVQRVPAGRPPRRAVQPRPRRPPDPHSAATARSCSAAWAGSPRTQCRQHQEQVARRHRPGRRPGRRRRRRRSSPGRRLRRVEPCTLKDGRPAYCYNLFGLQRFKVYGDSADPGRRAPGPRRVRLRRRRPGQGWHRHAVRRRRPRSARAGSTPPSR